MTRLRLKKLLIATPARETLVDINFDMTIELPLRVINVREENDNLGSWR